MDVKRHNGNVLPKKPRTLVRGFLIFRGDACCATKTGKSPSSNNPAPDVRNASCTATPATILHPTSATRTRFQLTPDRVRGCDSCPACTATRCR